MKMFFALALSALSLLACKPKNQQATPTAAAQDSLTHKNTPPKPDNAHYAPAFEGQTRAPHVQTQTDYEVILRSDKLQEPWGITPMPDGNLLLTENKGFMRLLNPETGEILQDIKGFPDVDDRAQGGMLGLCLSPEFEQDRMVFWTFTERVADGNHTAVAKGKLPQGADKIEQVQVIYRASPTYDGRLHYGGRILFDDAGNLLVSIGERSDKQTRVKAQDLSTSFGKIIRITRDGQAVASNPFVDQPEALPEIYSYGHRNPQGLAIHPETRALWSNEFGPRGGDELNLIEPGKNYGWPVITYGVEYSGAEIGDPPIQQKEGMEQPVYYWDPVLSPSGMSFYSGDAIPEWKNNLFLAGLSSQHIARLVLEDNRVVGEERLLADKGERFRAITEAKDGKLYAISQSGKLFVIQKK